MRMVGSRLFSIGELEPFLARRFERAVAGVSELRRAALPRPELRDEIRAVADIQPISLGGEGSFEARRWTEWEKVQDVEMGDRCVTCRLLWSGDVDLWDCALPAAKLRPVAGRVEEGELVLTADVADRDSSLAVALIQSELQEIGKYLAGQKRLVIDYRRSLKRRIEEIIRIDWRR